MECKFYEVACGKTHHFNGGMKVGLVNFCFFKYLFVYLKKFRVRDSTNCRQGVCLAEMDKHFKKMG